MSDPNVPRDETPEPVPPVPEPVPPVPERDESLELDETRGPAPRRSVRLWVTLGLLVVVLAVLAVVLSASEDGDGRTAASPSATATDGASVTIDGAPQSEMIAQGSPIPEWSAPALDGGTVVWSERPAGPSILAIWAPWCPHCQAELPRLAQAVEAHPRVSLVTIATAVDPQTGPTPAEYMASEGLSFPVGLDDEENTLAAGLGVQGFPTTYFVDPEGLVVAAASGELDPEAVDQILTYLEAS